MDAKELRTARKRLREMADADLHWASKTMAERDRWTKEWIANATVVVNAALAANREGPMLSDLRELRTALARVLEASPAYRRPVGAPNSVARSIQTEQIAAEDAAKLILERTEIYDAAR